ncbi:MAG: Rrf2 family transcriptional regulator [Leptolyngbya sp. PLA1]|nr:Rrf2 family transcriptional regulator [Leptolyngbya sp. PLA1]
MVSQTTEYALRAMMYLAADADGPRTSREIAVATGVPRSYLSKIMRSLVRAGLVRSARGKHGGFVLARDSSVISVLDIANAIDPIRRVTHARFHRCLDEALQQVEQALRHFSLATAAGASATPVDPRRTA